MENIDFRELKNDSFLSHEGQPEVIGKLSGVTCQRNSGDVFQNWVFAVLVKKTRVFFIRDSADFTVERVCNLGNFSYTFKMAASEQLEPFLLVYQAQRLDIGSEEKIHGTCSIVSCSDE